MIPLNSEYLILEILKKAMTFEHASVHAGCHASLPAGWPKKLQNKLQNILLKNLKIVKFEHNRQVLQGIVWLVDKVVNGEHVLVPQLYLAKLTRDNIDPATGSIIQGHAVALKSTQGGIENAGKILATTTLDLDAKNDIKNVGGDIAGHSVAIKSTDGSIINQTLVDTYTTNQNNGTNKASIVRKTATITSSEGLSLDAGDSIQVIGATVTAGGNAEIKAKNDVVVTSIAVENRTESKIGDSYRLNESTTHQGSAITAGTNLSMTSTDKGIAITGSTLTAGGDANLTAKADIKVTSEKDSVHSISADKSTSSGLLTSTTTSTRSEDYTESLAQAGIKTGGALNIKTEGNLDLTAAKLDLANGGSLDANNITETGLVLDDIHIKEVKSNTNLNLGIVNFDIHTMDERESKKNWNGSTPPPKTQTDMDSQTSLETGNLNSFGLAGSAGAGSEIAGLAGAGSAGAGSEITGLAGQSNLKKGSTTASTTAGATGQPGKANDPSQFWAGSSIKTGGALAIKTKKDLLIEGSDIGGKGSVNLDVGGNQVITSAKVDSQYEYSKEETNFDLGKSIGNIGNVQIKDNGVEATLATYTGTSEHTLANQSNQVASNIVTSGKFTAKSGGDTVVIGSNITAAAVDMTAGGSMTVMSAQDVQSMLKEASDLTITLKARVGNQYVEDLASLADAYQSAQSAYNSATGDNSKATALAQTAKALQAAIATARLANAAQAVSQTAASTPLLGFYAELKAERDETKTSTQFDSSTAKKSSITATGGDLTLTAGEKVVIVGSDLASARDITLAGKAGVDVVSAEELNSLKNSTAHNNETASIGTRGASASYSQDSSNTTGTGVTNVNSTVLAGGTFKVKTDGDFTFAGAEGMASVVDLTEVKGDTVIASKADTNTQTTDSQHMGVSNTSASYGISQDKSSSQAVNNQTMLIGSEAVKTGGKALKVKGAILANATIETDPTSGQATLKDKGNMTIANSEVEVTNIKSTVETSSEAYGAGKTATTTDLKFGKDTSLTETTSYGALGAYKKVTKDEAGNVTNEVAVAQNRDLNETQKVTKREESQGKVSVDIDDAAVTNTGEYVKTSVKNMADLAKNTNAIVVRTEGKVSDLADAVVDGVAKGNLNEGVDRYQGNETRRTTALNTKTEDLDKIVNNDVNTKADVKDSADTYKKDTDKANNVSTEGEVKYTDGQDKNVKGTVANNDVPKDGAGLYDNDNKDVYINTNPEEKDKQPLGQVLNHEVQHDIDNKTGKLATVTPKEAEARADHAGDQGNQALKDELALRDDKPDNTGKSPDTFKNSNPELVDKGTADIQKVTNAEASGSGYSGLSNLVNATTVFSFNKDKKGMDQVSDEAIKRLPEKAGDVVQAVPNEVYDFGSIATIPLPMASAIIGGLGATKTLLDYKENKTSALETTGSFIASGLAFTNPKNQILKGATLIAPLVYDTAVRVYKDNKPPVNNNLPKTSN